LYAIAAELGLCFMQDKHYLKKRKSSTIRGVVFTHGFEVVLAV
jgi:hypothetical protein